MPSAMRKMAVYLGLVEDDHRYQEKYDSYGEYEDYEESGVPEEPGEPDPRAARESWGEGEVGGVSQVPEWRPKQSADLARITTLHPRTYNEARTIGEHFREGTPVIMNLTEMVDSDARRRRLRGWPDLRPAREHRARDEQGLPAVPGERPGDRGGQGSHRRARLL